MVLKFSKHSYFSHLVISLSDAIYSIGGWKTRSVERFKPGSGWENMAPLIHPRAGAVGVARGDKIFVSGGYGDTACLSSMEVRTCVYNTM